LHGWVLLRLGEAEDVHLGLGNDIDVPRSMDTAVGDSDRLEDEALDGCELFGIEGPCLDLDKDIIGGHTGQDHTDSAIGALGTVVGKQGKGAREINTQRKMGLRAPIHEW